MMAISQAPWPYVYLVPYRGVRETLYTSPRLHAVPYGLLYLRTHTHTPRVSVPLSKCHDDPSFYNTLRVEITCPQVTHDSIYSNPCWLVSHHPDDSHIHVPCHVRTHRRVRTYVGPYTTWRGEAKKKTPTYPVYGRRNGEEEV